MRMGDINNENDDDRFEMFDLSMSVVTLLNYIKSSNHLRRYYENIDVMASKVKEDCKKTKLRVVKLKHMSRCLKKENDSLRKQLELTSKDRERYCRERDTLRNELHRLRHKQKYLPSEVRKFQEVEEELNLLRLDFERQTREDAKKIQEFEESSNEIIASQGNKILQLERKLEFRDKQLKELNELIYDKKDETRDITELQKNEQEKEQEISNLRDQLQYTYTKLHETEAELEETKTRLSKAMSDRLTDNNPNIADLSDKNRPTKLAERYTELFDNQWTDAFDLIGKYFHTEEDTIESLRNILQDAMIFCKKKAREQMMNLQRVLEFADNYEDKIESRDATKQLKDFRKVMCSVAFKKLYEMYLSHIRRSRDQSLRIALDVGSFTKECLEICWLMVVQDPPIVFAPEVNRGTSFKTDLFKPYINSGTHVDFVVWPALLLHKGGPVLAKGVAQGYRMKLRNNETSSITPAPYSDKIKGQSFNFDTQYSGHKDRNSVVGHRYRHDRYTERIPLGFDLVNPYYNYVNANVWNEEGHQAYEKRYTSVNENYY